MNYLVVGAGFSGATAARLLADAGHGVTVIDKRSHIGGNAYDRHDAHGVLVHEYGPHVFHTNSRRVFEFLSRFTAWRHYEHRVLAEVDGMLVPFPINRQTLRMLGTELAGEPREQRTSEDVAIASIGRVLTDKFIRGYTRKQWGRELHELDASVLARIPVREDDEDRYFTDAFQFIPTEGYTAMFRRMLDHKRICVRLGEEYSGGQNVIYTGPIDEYFGYRYGRLPYRSVRFRHEHLPHTRQAQPCATINHPQTQTFTRRTEFKHITGQRCRGTSIVYEYPCEEGDPYYPVPTAQSAALYERYQALAQASGTRFVGRLAQYRYYNMDQAVAAAMKCVA